MRFVESMAYDLFSRLPIALVLRSLKFNEMPIKSCPGRHVDLIIIV